MTKKPFYVLLILLILTLVYSIVFASNRPNPTTNSGATDNFHNTIIVALNIDYGRNTTESNYATLNLDVSGQDVGLNDLKVQFSLDNKNWTGFNTLAQKWEHGFVSDYQPYYPSFYIGSKSGLKTVYAKVIDSKGNVGLASAKINLSTESYNPHIVNPQSLELNNFEGPLSKAGVKNGSGTIYDPYIISSNNTKLVSTMPNVTEVSYYMDEGKWSPWYKVENEQANIPITFNNVEGLKEVPLRSKNQYGVEGNSEIIYYLLDKSKPTINLHTNYHSFIAIDGNLQFDLEVDDNLSKSFDFEVEVNGGGSSIVKRGQIEKYHDDRSTITSLTMGGLPGGKFKVKVTVTDEAGNKNTKQISVDSL